MLLAIKDGALSCSVIVLGSPAVSKMAVVAVSVPSVTVNVPFPALEPGAAIQVLVACPFKSVKLKARTMPRDDDERVPVNGMPCTGLALESTAVAVMMLV